MFEKIKSFVGKMSRKAKHGAALMSAAVGTAIMSVAASAESGETGSTTSGIKEVIETAGASLKNEFVTLVSTLVPVLIGIAVVGLGLYACIFLFRMAKKFFAQAAG